MNVKQKVFRVGLVSALALGMGAVVASPSGAVAPVQKCAHAKGSATLAPGLSAVKHNQKVTAKGTLSTCTPSKATGGSGTLSAAITLKNGSCQGLVGGGQKFVGTAKTTWKNKKTSAYSLTFTTGKGSAATVATIVGKVSTGLFKGHKVGGQIKFTPKSGQDCVTHAVTNVTFVQTKPWVIA